MPEDVSFSESNSHSATIEATPNGCSSDCKTGTYDLTIEPCSVEIDADTTELCPTKTTKLDGSYNCQEPPEECSSGFNWEIEGKNEEAPIKLVGGTGGKESVTVEAKQEAQPGETATVNAKPDGCSNCEEDTKQISIKEFDTKVSVTGDKKICAGATTTLEAELTECKDACDEGFAWTVKSGPARVEPEHEARLVPEQEGDKATLKMNKDAEEGKTATVVANPKCEALSGVKDSAEISVKPCEIELTSGADGTELCPGDEFTVKGETNCEHDNCTTDIDFTPSGPISERDDKQNKAKYEVTEEAKHKAKVSIDSKLNCTSNCEVKNKIQATVKHKCNLDRLTVNRRELCKGDTATFTAVTNSDCPGTHCKVDFNVSGAGKVNSRGNRSVTVEATRDGGFITVEATAKNCSESDGGCSDSRSIPIGGSGAGGYALEKPDTQYIGTTPEGLQSAVRSFDLDNATSFVTSDEANVTGVVLKQLKVSVERKKVALDEESEQRMFHRFPWLRGDSGVTQKPIITGVAVEGEFKEDGEWKEDYFKNVNRDKREQEVTLEKNIVLTDEVLNAEDLYDEVGVHIESPGTAVKVTIKPDVKVYYEGKCGNDREYPVDEVSATGTLKYKGLTIEKMPNYVFGDADYWMPIRVELPETLRGRHFADPSEDEPNEIGVERVSVQLMHRKSQSAAPDSEIEAHFAKDSGTDGNDDDIDEDEFGSSDPTNTIRWGLGEGTTSGGGFTPAGDDFTIQGQGRQGKKRELTVFVNLKKLMKKKLSGAIAETGNGKIHLFNEKKEVSIPRFRVIVELSAEDGITESFTSLTANRGRPKAFADRSVPAIDLGAKEGNNEEFDMNRDSFQGKTIFKSDIAQWHLRFDQNYSLGEPIFTKFPSGHYNICKNTLSDGFDCWDPKDIPHRIDVRVKRESGGYFPASDNLGDAFHLDDPVMDYVYTFPSSSKKGRIMFNQKLSQDAFSLGNVNNILTHASGTRLGVYSFISYVGINRGNFTTMNLSKSTFGKRDVRINLANGNVTYHQVAEEKLGIGGFIAIQAKDFIKSFLKVPILLEKAFLAGKEFVNRVEKELRSGSFKEQHAVVEFQAWSYRYLPPSRGESPAPQTIKANKENNLGKLYDIRKNTENPVQVNSVKIQRKFVNVDPGTQLGLIMEVDGATSYQTDEVLADYTVKSMFDFSFTGKDGKREFIFEIVNK